MKTTNQISEINKISAIREIRGKNQSNGEATKIRTLIELPAVLLKITPTALAGR
jgi:hypothetical protein